MVVAKKKQSPLRAALDNERGTNYHLLKQRKQEKSAAKRRGVPLHNSSSQPKRKKIAHENVDAIIESEDEDYAEANEELDSGSVSDDEDEEVAMGTSLADQVSRLAAAAKSVNPERNTKYKKGLQNGSLDNVGGDGWGTDSEEEEHDTDEQEDKDQSIEDLTLGVSFEPNGIPLSGAVASEEDEDEDEDIPLSDLEDLDEGEDADIIPHQRLTINNTAALQSSLSRIALSASTPFSAHMSVIGQAPTAISDVEDDLSRERSLYAQALDAAQRARPLLAEEGLPFTRPNDYFAEMVKTDAHMGKIRARLVDDAARKKASQDARRMREAKKFGKAVQQEKLKERAAAKRAMLDNVASLKRKRQGEAALGTTEEGLFDVALEDAAETERREKADRRKGGAHRSKGSEPSHKRQKKDEKFGFGGKKRHHKSNDAASAGDMRGHSAGKKGKVAVRTSKKLAPVKRPGKSRRARASV